MVNKQCFILQIYENSFDRQAKKRKLCLFSKAAKQIPIFAAVFKDQGP